VQNKGRPEPGKQDKHLRMISCLMKMKMTALMMMRMTVMMKKMRMKMMALMMKKMMVVMMKKKLQESILLQRIQKKNQIHLKTGELHPLILMIQLMECLQATSVKMSIVVKIMSL
jgi:hypothetical protein